MAIVTDARATREFLDVLRRARVAVPCFCTENAWTTEAVLTATRRAGDRFGLADPPVMIAFTAGYPGRSNLANYWQSGHMRSGLRGLLGTLEALVSPGSPYETCRVFPFLDHGQPDADAWLLEGQLDRLAGVMFDASAMPFEENVSRTADYVRRFGDCVVVEGAVDELKEAANAGEAFPMTTPAQARRFLQETGCDLIVPNVGTEHRAAEAGMARYHAERARAISAEVGPNLVLHGTSCMGRADLSSLPDDGFVKVNIWTIIEKTGAVSLVRYVLDNVGRMVGQAELERLVADGILDGRLLSDGCVRAKWGGSIGPTLRYFPLVAVRERWVASVAEVLESYFEMFGYARLADAL